MGSYSAGYIYALSNEALIRDLYKIGKTVRSAEDRAWEIYVGATGVPAPYRVALAFRVSNCDAAEARVHEALAAYRYNRDREFFLVPLETVREAITRIGNAVTAEFHYVDEPPPPIPEGALATIREVAETPERPAQIATARAVPIRLIRQPAAPIAEPPRLNFMSMAPQPGTTRQTADAGIVSPVAVVSAPAAEPQRMYIRRPLTAMEEKMMAESPGWTPPPDEPWLANGWAAWWLFVIIINITALAVAGLQRGFFSVVLAVLGLLIVVGRVQARAYDKAYKEWLHRGW
jgi:hypothetical protein